MARQWFGVRQLPRPQDTSPWEPYVYDLGVGYWRHPTVDPKTGRVSAADDSIAMGRMRHCEVPEPHRLETCTQLMDDHGWIDNGVANSDGTTGTTVCPGMWIED